MYRYQPGRDKKCEYCGENYYHTHADQEVDSIEKQFSTFLIFTKQQWLMNPIIKFTEQEIDNADDKGLIGIKGGTYCYVSKFVQAKNMV